MESARGHISGRGDGTCSLHIRLEWSAGVLRTRLKGMPKEHGHVKYTAVTAQGLVVIHSILLLDMMSASLSPSARRSARLQAKASSPTPTLQHKSNSVDADNDDTLYPRAKRRRKSNVKRTQQLNTLSTISLAKRKRKGLSMLPDMPLDILYEACRRLCDRRFVRINSFRSGLWTFVPGGSP